MSQATDLLTATEAAAMIGIASSGVRRACREGRMPHASVRGRQWMIRRDGVGVFLARRRAPVAPRVLAELERDPGASLATIAARAGCSKSMVSLVRRGLR